MRKYRTGELDALYFDKLPMRCKEMIFEYYYPSFPSHDEESKKTVFGALNYCFDACKSPIEVILAFGFEILVYDRLNKIPYFDLIPQYEITTNGKRYFADLYFDTQIDFDCCYKYENDLKLIIECDGHEFHEKTKEQVAHNNERDLNLKLAGYDVLHFSGSQIYNDPFKCAEEIINYILLKIGRWEKLD